MFPFTISIALLTLSLVKVAQQIQIGTGVESNGNGTSNRQGFHHPTYHLQFQYRPDFGGPWQTNSGGGGQFWNQNTGGLLSPAKPVIIHGSATPVQFPGPVNNNFHYRHNQSSLFTPDIMSMTPGNENSRGKSSLSGFRTTNSCRCGVVPKAASGTLERITGGVLSKENAWPWMAAVVYIGRGAEDKPFWFCGASLINERYLITAAHCQRTIRRRGLSNIRVLLGENNIPTKGGDKSRLFEISEVKTHPMYRQFVEEYDIGLLKLKEKVTFSDKISPICLTQKGAPFVDKLAIVAGWGSITYGDSPPDSLREVEIKVVTNAACNRDYMANYGTRITGPMLCAWLPGKDSCQGDSGGPLFMKKSDTEGTYTQIGVVSFGPPQCGSTSLRIPGVYTRLSSTIRWIKANTREASFCEGTF